MHFGHLQGETETKVYILSKLKVLVSQSYLTLWDRMDYIVHGILQAGILERVAVPFSGGSF